MKVKTLRIFARSFGVRYPLVYKKIFQEDFLNIDSNEKNVSTFQEKEKKQTWF